MTPESNTTIASSPAGDSVRMFRDEVEVAGHIIDSLILPKVLDIITAAGGTFQIKTITIGQGRSDPSYALVEVAAASPAALEGILRRISDHGAVPVAQQDCRQEVADMDGAFPEGFYSTTNQQTEVRIDGEWLDVADQEMDCGLVIDPTGPVARCVPMTELTKGDLVVIGHAGVRVIPLPRSVERDGFEFMASDVSTEKPKGVIIREIARELHRCRAEGHKVVLVCGPAIIHTGSGKYLCELIRDGYVQVLLAGNALATHDIEQAMYGTSLGVHLEHGGSVDAGHEHHLRAINRIRRAGGIAAAVESGVLSSGVMYECIRRNVDYLLAGSIRDDGPLPDVVTDALEAQRQMRAAVRDAEFCLMIATTLHSIAVGNLLPASVGVVCADINPSTVIKLADRGSFQSVGLVTDVEPFMRSLVDELRIAASGGSSTSP